MDGLESARVSNVVAAKARDGEEDGDLLVAEVRDDDEPDGDEEHGTPFHSFR